MTECGLRVEMSPMDWAGTFPRLRILVRGRGKTSRLRPSMVLFPVDPSLNLLSLGGLCLLLTEMFNASVVV